MADRIVLLGTGTCQLQPDRKASSVLVELGDLRIVFDVGRGVADRLAERGLRQDDVRHVAISHFHPDHWSDLVPYLHAASWSRVDPRTVDLHVWGPEGIEDRLARLLDPFGPGSFFPGDRFRLVPHEVPRGVFRIEGRELEFVDLPPSGNRGLRFASGSKVCALTGDSGFHDEEVEFLRSADLAVIDSGHIEDSEIVELAVRSGARRIVCSHLYRELDEAALNEAARGEGYEGRLSVGCDGETILI